MISHQKFTSSNNVSSCGSTIGERIRDVQLAVIITCDDSILHTVRIEIHIE
jgi:hypothetical protein